MTEEDKALLQKLLEEHYEEEWLSIEILLRENIKKMAKISSSYPSGEHQKVNKELHQALNKL